MGISFFCIINLDKQTQQKNCLKFKLTDNEALFLFNMTNYPEYL